MLGRLHVDVSRRSALRARRVARLHMMLAWHLQSTTAHPDQSHPDTRHPVRLRLRRRQGSLPLSLHLLSCRHLLRRNPGRVAGHPLLLRDPDLLASDLRHAHAQGELDARDVRPRSRDSLALLRLLLLLLLLQSMSVKSRFARMRKNGVYHRSHSLLRHLDLLRRLLLLSNSHW